MSTTFCPIPIGDPLTAEEERKAKERELAHQMQQDQMLRDMADSMKDLAELHRIADSADARAVAAQAAAKKASVTSWVSIIIALAACAWNVIAHFI